MGNRGPIFVLIFRIKQIPSIIQIKLNRLILPFFEVGCNDSPLAAGIMPMITNDYNQ